MALKAQWNLVLRLLVDNGLWVSMVRVNFVCLFGNVGFDFSDASGNHGCRFELQLWKCLSWTCSTVSQWKRPELCRKWKLFWTELETKQETLLWVCFHVLSGIWTVVYCHRQVRYDLRCLDCYSLFVKFGTDVAVETGTDAEKVYWTLRQVGTLELLSDWLNFVWRYFGSCIFPFGLEQPYRTSLDGWMSTEISASQFTVKRALWSL